ncbi:MAG: hypothetical protein MJZ02_09635 [Paludibacteraceae bacterium]|nr:hypothetical protein [Paludibacteraceae bacterium]
MNPPEIATSTAEERKTYVLEEYKCISNCENCGLCKFLRGRDAETAYADYIAGKREFIEITKEIRDNR